MKVVLFCGGFGMRLREYSENIPKPLVHVGPRPILWHVMKYYAHFGHKEFILCLGWKGEAIKEYFLNYNECVSNDFVFQGDGKVAPLQTDIRDWQITFVDTGADSNVGQRLLAVRPHLEGEEAFLANYSDGLSDLPLPRLIERFHDREAIAAFVAVHPQQSWHVVNLAGDGLVEDVQPISDCNTWMNGGFFVLRNNIFDYMEDGDELVDRPFQRLIARQELFGMKYDGFWSCMDTFKDKQRLEDMVGRGDTPWEIWKQPLGIFEGDASNEAAPLPLVKQRPR